MQKTNLCQRRQRLRTANRMRLENAKCSFVPKRRPNVCAAAAEAAVATDFRCSCRIRMLFLIPSLPLVIPHLSPSHWKRNGIGALIQLQHNILCASVCVTSTRFALVRRCTTLAHGGLHGPKDVLSVQCASQGCYSAILKGVQSDRKASQAIDHVASSSTLMAHHCSAPKAHAQ